MKNLKDKILYILEKYPETRDDDALLTFTIIREYYPDEVKLIEDKWFISTKALRIIREDNVKRLRATIQNEEHRFLPTKSDVVKKRKINEQVWREYLSRENTRM